MHLIIPIILAAGVAIWGYKTCNMKVFYIASIIAAALIGAEIQEGGSE